MTSNFNFTFPVEQLANAIVDQLRPQFSLKDKSQLADDKFLTRKETANKLNISLPTLNSYTKRGILIGYRVGARVLYKNSEVEMALLAISYVRH